MPRARTAAVADGALDIRAADPAGDDPQTCAGVYAPYVSTSAISFEYTPPSAAEIARRMRASYAWLIAERAGEPIGYAYGAPHAERHAYRWAADVAIYLDPAQRGAGVGRALYARLFADLRAAGVWTLCAGVTQPNDASNALHTRMGFVPVGTFRRIGWKAGAWHDVLWLQLDLRPGEPGGPEQEPARHPSLAPAGAPAPPRGGWGD